MLKQMNVRFYAKCMCVCMYVRLSFCFSMCFGVCFSAQLLFESRHPIQVLQDCANYLVIVHGCSVLFIVPCCSKFRVCVSGFVCVSVSVPVSLQNIA